jgi:hypothetical protein
MTRLLLLVLLLLTAPINAAENDAGKSAVGGTAATPIELGDGRLQVGAIVIDQAKQTFTTPGVTLRRADPIEFIAVTQGGHKSYESIVELETNAFDFNLACILIGLDNSRATRPQRHFDPAPVRGNPVDISISWQQQGETRTVAAADLLSVDGRPVTSHRWRYNGSWFGAGGRYKAEEFGTLIGFVHDEDSIIHHREGLGLDNYGGVKLNQALAPPEGAPVLVTVSRPASAGGH